MSTLRIVRTTMQGLSPMQRLQILNRIDLEHEDSTSARIERNVRQADAYEQLPHFAEGEQVAIWVWQRDCDCCEGTSCHIIRPTRKALDAFIERTYLGAEGPVSWSIHRPSEPFESYTRDRVLEAFEDGHPYSV